MVKLTPAIIQLNVKLKQMKQEVRSWPYDFPSSEDFSKSVERGFIFGRLLVSDR